MSKILILVTVVLLLVLPIGIFQVVDQHHQLVASVPISATVLSSKLITHENYREAGPPERTYEPVITYQYVVNGVEHTSSNVFPLQADTGTSNWASHLLSQYPVGATVVAYVLPGDANRAFLIRRPSYIPYLIALVPMFLPAFFIGDWLSGYSRRRKLAVNHESSSSPLIDLRAVAFRKAIFISAIWILYTGILLTDYLRLRSGSLDAFTLIAITIAVGASAIVLFNSPPPRRSTASPR